jgi:hypothetical protein
MKHQSIAMREGEGAMRRQIALLEIVGFFGLVGAAVAQTLSSAPGASLDGTYRFVSSTRVNHTYVTRGGHMGQCPSRRAGPLTIFGGQAHYTTATGRKLRGRVGPQGELAMRMVAPPSSGGGIRPFEISVSGNVDGAGTARARQKSNSCSYDFVWQK